MDGHQIYDGPTVRAIRQRAGIRMITLASAAEVSYAHLRMFEAGSRNISPVVAHRLASALTELALRPISVDDFARPFRQDGAA
jgi:predicted transcriptional regulator